MTLIVLAILVGLMAQSILGYGWWVWVVIGLAVVLDAGGD